jgi:hypothetical protein
MQVFVEEQVSGLDVAVEDAVGVDPGDCLGGLAAPGQPLLEGERLADSRMYSATVPFGARSR